MAVTTYYGTCNTAANVVEKRVQISSDQITTNNFSLNIGDLLVVYFTHTNTQANPSIVLVNKDTNQEISTSNNSGKFIKTRSVNVDAVGAWDNGETVIFAYTYNTNLPVGNDYYWELINGAPSTIDVYGATKLFGESSTDVPGWLKGQDRDTDYTTALTPGILKKFYNWFQDSSDVNLHWYPISSEELTTLGQLSPVADESKAISITYPLNNAVVSIINDTVSKTSDLINDGPDPNKANATAKGKFYITNVLPSGTSLYYKTSGEPYEFLIPNNSGNLVLKSGSQIRLEGSGAYINGALALNGNLNMSSKTITSGTINCGPITANGVINAGANQIITTGEAHAGEVYEGGKSLKTKYSGLLNSETIETEVITIKANKQTGHKYTQALTRSGYTPVGIIGFNINFANAASTGDATWCSLWEETIVFKDGVYMIQYAVRNHYNKDIKVRIRFKVLYVKNT